jgi:hypothetical protein
VSRASGAPCAPPGPITVDGQWLDGDTHVHTDHSSDGSGPRQGSDDALPGNNGVGDQIGEAELVGLDFLPLTDHRSYEQQWDPAWTSSKLLLVPGEEANGAPHATVHGATDQVPDGPNPVGAPAYRHFQQSIWDVHAQDANWSTAHPDDGEVESVGEDGSIVPNGNADAVGVDVVEVFNGPDGAATRMAYAENRWNAGWRFGVVAASDSHFKELWPIAGPGQPRTRVLAATPTERGVVDALRSAHTSISQVAQGAAVTLFADADGAPGYETVGGDEVRVAPDGCVRFRLSADLASGLTLRLVGDPGGSAAAPIASFTVLSASEVHEVEVAVPSGQHWYRVDAVAPDGRLLATASPVFTFSEAPATPSAAHPLPADDSAVDAATPVLARQGRFTGFPDVAVERGRTHVVAERHAPGSSKVVYAGDKEGEVDLAPTSSAARFPRVAARGSDVWVVWEDERAGQLPHRPVVYLRHSGDRGRSWDPERALTDGTGRAIRPVVAATKSGPVVAWSDNRGGAFDVYAQRIGTDPAPVNLSAEGKVVVQGNPALDSRSPRYPASLFPTLATTARGDITVAWTDNRNDRDPGWTGGTGAGDGTHPDDWEVLARTLSSEPASKLLGWSPLVNVSATPDRADRLPTLVADNTGVLTAAWESKELRASGAAMRIRTSRSTDGGRTWSAAQELPAANGVMARRPRAGLLEDGRVGLVWYDTESASWRYHVRRATFADGRWSAPVDLTGRGNATFPALSNGAVVFASDREATGQRDRTFGVFLLR